MNLTGPYNQLESWTPVPEIKPLTMPLMPTGEASDAISKKYGFPLVEWEGKYDPLPSKPEIIHHQCTSATTMPTASTYPRLWTVPLWARFGTFRNDTNMDIMQEQYLPWHMSRDYLHPYWKVGNMETAWKELFDML